MAERPDPMLPPELGRQAWRKCHPAIFPGDRGGGIWHYLPLIPSGLGILWLEVDPTGKFPYMWHRLFYQDLWVTAKGGHNLEMGAETYSGLKAQRQAWRKTRGRGCKCVQAVVTWSPKHPLDF